MFNLSMECVNKIVCCWSELVLFLLENLPLILAMFRAVLNVLSGIFVLKFATKVDKIGIGFGHMI